MRKLVGVAIRCYALGCARRDGSGKPRIAFDRAGLLYLTVGERQEQDRAQKPGDHGGKVLRLRDDGSVPPDNPFAGKQGYLPEIYSLGHRSPQGLAMNPATGALWENEHGPLGGDELNIIQAGKNYGWPLVTFGTDYDGTKISDSTWRADLEAPFWGEVMALFALGGVSPWLTWTDPAKYGPVVDTVQDLDITTIAGCHTPVIEGPFIGQAFDILRGLPTLGPVC